MENAFDTFQQKSEQYWQRLLETGHDLSSFHDKQDEIKNVMGLSDFAAENLIRFPTLINDVYKHNEPVSDVNHYYQGLLTDALEGVSDENRVSSILRTFRNQQMSKIAILDLLNKQDIQISLAQVSALADQLISQAYDWVYQHFCQRYGTPQGEYGPQPLLILGMGKLGGKELNFSSDIDLIFAYPNNGEIAGSRKSVEHQTFFTKVAQKLITLLHHTNADGQVFRVDMRLRPFGESGPLVTQFSALEDYYQDQGREWERYAMIKARILNHQGPYAEQLKSILKPFVYRRYLDFGAIDSLRNMKQLISQEVRRRGLNNNIKLGAGGIREVEFIVQSFQLIRGGREPQLQQAGLLQNLIKLADMNALSMEESTQITESYLYLRKVEHCLQQFNDQQTQLLPDDPLDQYRLIQVMEENDYQQLLVKIDHHRNRINAFFSNLIGEEDSADEQNNSECLSALQDVWQLDLNTEEVTNLLEQWLSPDEASHFETLLKEFKQSLSKKGMGQKGLDTLHSLLPVILEKVVDADDTFPGLLLKRCLIIVSAIMGRTTYLQLLNENHGALAQLVRLCAASPWIAEQLARFPILLDELINPSQLYHPTPLAEYHSELRQLLLRVDPDDLELQMETLRQFKLSQQLKIAAADVTGALPIMEVSDHLTYLAEAIIEEVVSLAWQQMTDKHGSPEGKDQECKGFAVVGYGKLGGIELGYGSDLDLVFIHNADTRTNTGGDKSIDSSRFYTKLAQRIMHLLNTKTSSGQLYEIDMRLRPSGNAGLLVCHTNGFHRYQLEEAWTWEHQALVRARIIYAESDLVEVFTATRKIVLCQTRDQSKLKKDVQEMREKMRSHLSQGDQHTFDIKQDTGGIADIEFMVQYWVLAHAKDIPALTLWSDNVRILQDLARHKIIDGNTASELIDIYLQYRNTSHRLALQQKQVQEDARVFSAERKAVSAIWQHTFSDESD